MLNKRKKLSAYMAMCKSERGFTFVSMLFMLTILAISLPFLAYLTKSASYTTSFDEIAVRQFFQFLRDDMIEALDYHVTDTGITLIIEDKTKEDDVSIVTIEKYNDLIRRQVDKKGHEIYLQGVENFAFVSHPYGLRVSVTSLQGEQYEKTFIFYK